MKEIDSVYKPIKTNYVAETDIKVLFDNVDYRWLMKMLLYDIAD